MMQATKEIKEQLNELYERASKHGQYQTLPDKLATALEMQFEVNEEWRGDRTRYPVIKGYLAKNKCNSVLDIGANTGYFSLSIADDIEGSQITACELNKTHARIIELLAKVGGYNEFRVTDRSANMEHIGDFGKFDCALHLNILHHAGHDFDKELVPDREAFMQYGKKYLKMFGSSVDRMIFQMGYNWGGDKTLPLVGRDDQAGKIAFTLDLMDGAGWEIEGVALAKKGDKDLPIAYDVYSLHEIKGEKGTQKWLEERYGADVWSEFYQRPLWLCKVKR